MTVVLAVWLVLGVACYAVLLLGAYRARHSARSGYGWLAVVLAPVLIVVAPLLVARVALRRRGAPRSRAPLRSARSRPRGRRA